MRTLRLREAKRLAPNYTAPKPGFYPGLWDTSASLGEKCPKLGSMEEVQNQQPPAGSIPPLSRQCKPADSPGPYLCKATQHVFSGDPHVVQLQEAIVRVLKVHLGPDISSSDS